MSVPKTSSLLCKVPKYPWCQKFLVPKCPCGKSPCNEMSMEMKCPLRWNILVLKCRCWNVSCQNVRCQNVRCRNGGKPALSFGTFDLWIVWAEIECTVYVSPPKQPINQSKSIQQSRQHTLKAYCPSLYTVSSGEKMEIYGHAQWSLGRLCGRVCGMQCLSTLGRICGKGPFNNYVDIAWFR